MHFSRPIKGIILDFDGLILDTESPELNAWIEVFNELGLAFPEAEYLQMVGRAVDDAQPLHFLKRYLTTPYNPKQILEDKRLIVARLLDSAEVMPGVKRLLNDAKKYDLKIGLASNSDSHWVIGHLEKFDLLRFFSCVKTSENVVHAKPDPSLYSESLACMKLEANDVIAFEDSQNGVMSASRAGIFTIAVPNRVTRFMDFSAANTIINSLEDFSLLKYL